MLGIFAGSDTISAVLVVGAFLAGLSIGSIIGAKIADRITPARALIGFATETKKPCDSAMGVES
jgi:spermidine synthase